MPISSRVFVTQQAMGQISQALLSIIQEHDLTFGEIMLILADLQKSWAYHLTTEERRPERDKEIEQVGSDD
jgi:hypothetical protein